MKIHEAQHPAILLENDHYHYDTGTNNEADLNPSPSRQFGKFIFLFVTNQTTERE